jgi:hypothetical protein
MALQEYEADLATGTTTLLLSAEAASKWEGPEGSLRKVSNAKAPANKQAPAPANKGAAADGALGH